MLNRIWFFLLLIGIVYGFAKGAYRAVTVPAVPLATSQPASQGAEGSTHPLRDAGQTLTEAALG